MIYVMSDIHGHRRRFDSVMKQINLQPEDTLYILGDVIDRNPDGIRILQQLRAMPNVVMLLGNHEYMMLDALYNIPDEEDGYADYLREKRLNLWYRNGGDVTHRYLKHIRKSVRQEILEYLDKLPVNIEIMVNGQKYLLTHAAPEDEYLNSSMKHRDGREFAVWHRYRSHDRGPDDYTVIFGHTPTTEHQLAKPATIWNGRNLIDIDCGAAYEEIDVWGIVIKTRLACLRLDDMKEFYSEEDLNEEGNQRRCVFCPYKWFELEYETIEVAVDEVLLAQIKEIITPLGWTVERLIVRFLEWLVDPETQKEAIAWLMKAKEELGEK